MFLLCVVMVFTACNVTEPIPSEPNEEALKEHIINVGIVDVPDSYDVGLSAEAYGMAVIENVFEGLVRFGPQGNIIPAAAKSWLISSDGLTYTFTLRPDLKFSNGQPLTAKDFEFAFKRLIKLHKSSQNNYLVLPYIKNAQAFADDLVTLDEVGVSSKGPSELVITLEKSTPFMMQLLATRVYSPLYEAAVKEMDWFETKDNWVTNGAFKVNEIKEDGSIQLVKNPYYWDVASVKIDTINIQPMGDSVSAYEAYKAGLFDVLYAIPESSQNALNDPGYRVEQEFGVFFYVFNTKKPPFDDESLRHALSMVLDRTEISTLMPNNPLTPIVGLMPYGMMLGGKDFRLSGHDFGYDVSGNPDKGKKEFDQYKASHETLMPLEILYYNTDETEIISYFLQKTWRETLGLDADVVGLEWSDLFSRVIAGDFQIAAMGISPDFIHPEAFLAYFRSDSTVDLTGYKNPDFDALIDQARASATISEATALYHDAEKILIDDAVILPIYQSSNQFMVNPDLKGYTIMPTDFYYFGHAHW